MMPVPWKLWEGQIVDQCFPLRRYLGGTGRSAVYRTQYGDPELRNAAIKLVLAETGESDLAAQWERAAQLSHPHLLRLFRTGGWHANHLAMRYAVTEYAEENLAEVLAERPLTTGEVRQMLRPLLEALAYLHGEGLVHGHLKPANIMAVGDELKLSVDGISLVGEAGDAPGTPGPYDPPEFPDRGCSPVGDIWSFGMTLVETLTRQLPVVSPNQEPVLPETLPAEFLPLVRACLRLDPRRRASPYDLLTQFEGAGPAPVVLPAEEPPAAPRKWLNPALVSAAAVALAGVLVAPRLLHRPAASAPAVQAAMVPAPTPVTTVPPTAQAAQPVPAPGEAPPVPSHATRAPKALIEAPPGLVLHQVMPEVTDQARRTIRGKVRIQVRATVDPAGRVTRAAVESQNSRYFASLTLKAAQQWTFAPQEAAGEWLLRFELTPSGTIVRPSKVAR